MGNKILMLMNSGQSCRVINEIDFSFLCAQFCILKEYQKTLILEKQKRKQRENRRSDNLIIIRDKFYFDKGKNFIPLSIKHKLMANVSSKKSF